MATNSLTHRPCCLFGIALVVVALLAPSAHVPPAWWQGGWRRQCFGSAEEVELLSSLAAILMPNTPVGDLFRSFPSSDGQGDLEPTMTAYGVMKDPNVALFVLYDGKHGKRESINHAFRKRLLAYGPPGSHILHISHKESRPLEDMVLSIQLGVWHPGDEASLSLVLDDIRTQVSIGLKQVLCPGVLKQLDSQKGSFLMLNMHDLRNVTVALRDATVNEESLEHRFFSKGFSPASTNRMLKSAHLIGRCVEAKLASRIQCLLDLNQSHAQIREAIATSSPALGDTLQQDLKPTVQWLFDQTQVGKATTTCPSILCRRSLEPTVLWLLDLGLSQRQVVKVVGCCPAVLVSSAKGKSKVVQRLEDLGLKMAEVATTISRNPEVLGDPSRLHSTLRRLLALGLKESQVAKVLVVFPQLVGFGMEENLTSKLQWFAENLQLGEGEVIQAIAKCPRILTYSIAETVRTKVDWLLKIGLSKNQIGKAFCDFPVIFGGSIVQNWKPKVAWLLDLGMTKRQVSKVISSFPQVLGYSAVRNLKPKMEWFASLGLAKNQIVKVIGAFPRILGYSTENNKATVLCFMKLGLTKAQFVKVIKRFPQVLGSTEESIKAKVEWFLTLGVSKDQVARLVAGFPQILGYSIEHNFKLKVELFLELGLTNNQIAKVILACPFILCCSLAQNLKPKVQWLSDLGMSREQVVKAIVAFPKILGYNKAQNLKPTVDWLILDMGMSREQVVKVITSFPQILGLSIERNLAPKQALLQKVLGAQGGLDAVLRGPQIMGLTYQRLSTRLRILVKRNETAKLVTAMKMTRESFRRRFLDEA